jgi:AcrR family transcriptional regulator
MDKKTQIINAAIEVFAKQGLEKGKIADIANVADIGKGTIYEYFKSKDEIFKAIEEMFIFQSIHQFNSLAESNKSPTEKITNIINYSVNMHEEMGDATLIIAELLAQHGREQLRGYKESTFSEMYNAFNSTVIKVLDEGIKENEFREMNKEGISALLLAFIDGVIWQSVLFNTDKKFNLRVKQAIQSFMNGIKK